MYFQVQYGHRDLNKESRRQRQMCMRERDAAQTRTSVMNRALRSVEALPDEQALQLLPGGGDADGAGGNS